MTHCTNCSDSVSANDVRWALDQPYCDGCFDNLFNYCSDCDNVIYRENTYYDSDSNPYCSDCFEDDYDDEDDDCPDNPEVYEEDRKEIIHLSRQWLEGKLDTKKHIGINKKDYFLKNIRAIVGLVEKPVYVYGLKDRDEYQIAASENFINKAKEYFSGAAVIQTIGVNRLGISFTLRKTRQEQIVNLIKTLTS